MKHIIILGGGQSAAYAAKEIREVDTQSQITIISEEKNLPYERPPLSKDFLLEKLNLKEFLFFSNEFYKEKNINIKTSEKIIKVNFENKTLISSTNNNFTYDQLLIATGSSNRKLNIENLDQNIENEIIYLRDVEESKVIKDRMKSAKEIVIIGGGFIGLEIASSAAQLGKNVSVVEMGKQLMGRAIPKEIANIVQVIHEENGNKFYLETHIKKITKNNNSFQILLNSNISLSADLIIAGIGSLPNTSLFTNSPLEIDNGIITDEFSQTSIPDVFAAGDVANFFHPFYGMHMRLESFKHAQNHGVNAAKNILGIKTIYDNIPWMWSDQFNLNLQMTGICNDYETFVQRGSNTDEGIIYFFLKNRMIRGACGLGVGGKIGRDIRLAGKLSEKRVKMTKETLSNKNLKLNKLLSKSST
jgi:3-phenylpropionate/trans-cinnamate dioxygenase ferredoxin reductase subunit